MRRREFLTLGSILAMGKLGRAGSVPRQSASPAAGASSIRFRDIGAEAGLTTVPNFSPEKRYVIETTGGGIALFDCDNDGRLDIAVTNDTTIERYLAGGDRMITLYRQGADRRFKDITESAGLSARGWGMGLAVGDYDNDGLPDLYVTGYGRNVLYHNLGGGKFEDVTDRAGVAGGGFSLAAAWADYDRDGHLDLFVSRYVPYDIHHLPRLWTGSAGGRALPVEGPVKRGETYFLFHNRGDGTFEEVAQKAGVSNPRRRRGMGAVWGDYDNDGWPDLYVNNDVGPSFLFHNNRDGTFTDVGMLSGTALDSDGQAMGNMAADFGDFDRDGNLDLTVTRWSGQAMALYHNEKQGFFLDIASSARIAEPSFYPVKWGGGFADFDNDGWLDILVANGNVSPLVDPFLKRSPYREPLLFFHYEGDLTYRDISSLTGLNAGPLQSRRGTAFGDIFNTGRVGAAVYNLCGPPSLFVNETRDAGHCVLFRLVGAKSNRAAIGARVTVHTPKMIQMDEVRGGGSYASSNDQRLHFGLGGDAVMSRVEIRWPSGLKETLTAMPADAIYEITEGKGITNKTPLQGL